MIIDRPYQKTSIKNSDLSGLKNFVIATNKNDIVVINIRNMNTITTIFSLKDGLRFVWASETV